MAAFCQAVSSISIHALLAESDTSIAGRITSNGIFLSTLSLRRATPTASRRKTADMNFYPRSPCGERRSPEMAACNFWNISIHALLAESDLGPVGVVIAAVDFYPRSPCGERPALLPTDGLFFLFLSTLSLRRATKSRRIVKRCQAISIHALLAESDRPPGLLHSWRCYFYPRSPCGERPTNRRPIFFW